MIPETQRPRLIAAARSGIGRYRGGLLSVRADDLAVATLQGLLARHPFLKAMNWAEILLGCANQAGEDSRNVARQIALLAGLPESVSATTINQLCGSSLKALMLGAQTIQSSQAEAVLVGGVEQMSRSPLALLPPWVEPHAALQETVFGWRFSNPRFDGSPARQSMLETAEAIACDHGITPAQQNAIILSSHQKAVLAHASHWHQLIPIPVPQDGVFQTDEVMRAGLQAKQLQRLKPVQPEGLITAAGATGYADGAGWLALCSPDQAEAMRREAPLQLAMVAMAQVAGPPATMGLLAVPAIQQVLKKSRLNPEAIALWEIHEPFAATHQVNCQLLGLDPLDERVNGWGGSLALGAPMGMIGVRLATTLFQRFEQQPQAEWGLIGLPVGMGQGLAVLFKRV